MGDSWMSEAVGKGYHQPDQHLFAQPHFYQLEMKYVLLCMYTHGHTWTHIIQIHVYIHAHTLICTGLHTCTHA